MIKNKINGEVQIANLLVNGVGLPLTGWKCAVCFENAQVWMIDVTLCEDHARRYKYGYGENLLEMFEKINKK